MSKVTPYCPECREGMEMRNTDAGARWVCPACGRVVKHTQLQSLIHQLRERGYHLRAIAKALGRGVSPRDVERWYRGDPLHNGRRHIPGMLRALLQKPEASRRERRGAA